MCLLMNILKTDILIITDYYFKAKTNQLLVNLRNVDQRKKSPLVDHTGTLPTDWKQRNCFNELGETWNSLWHTQIAAVMQQVGTFCVLLALNDSVDVSHSSSLTTNEYV